MTSTPKPIPMKKTKKQKSNGQRRQSVQQQNDEASPTEADKHKVMSSSDRRAMLQTLPLSSRHGFILFRYFGQI